MIITLHVNDDPIEPYMITCPSDVANLDKIARKKTECFGVITLNAVRGVIKTRVLFTGTVNACMSHPRDVFRAAILDNAAAIVIFHNHPSGQVAPSQNDKDVTKGLVKAGELLSIPVVDHVIVSKDGIFSFAEMGLISAYKTIGEEK